MVHKFLYHALEGVTRKFQYYLQIGGQYIYKPYFRDRVALISQYQVALHIDFKRYSNFCAVLHPSTYVINSILYGRRMKQITACSDAQITASHHCISRSVMLLFAPGRCPKFESAALDLYIRFIYKKSRKEIFRPLGVSQNAGTTQGVSRTPIKDTILFSDVKWVGKSNSEVRLRTASLGEKLEPDY